MNREQFEKLEEVKNSLSEYIVFVGNKYTTPNEGFYDLVNWLNGAWYAWQEQQLKRQKIENYIFRYLGDSEHYGDLKELLK